MTKRVNFIVDFLCSDVGMVVKVDMKKWLIAVGFLVLLALDWAALHNIIKGKQDVWMEWSFVLLSLILLFFIIYKWLKVKSNNQ